jgi:hypothetical protein
MRTLQSRSTLIPAVAAAIVLAGATFAYAADQPAPSAPPAPSKEMREKMATLHERMAACLRSDKPIAECHTEMRKNCQELMGKDGCPRMGMGKRGWKTRPPTPTAPEAK